MPKNQVLVKRKKEAICELYPKLYDMSMCLGKRSKKEIAKDKIQGKKPHLYCRRRGLPLTHRCPKHGGLSSGAPPSRGGKYSRWFNNHGKSLAEIFETFRTDPDILTLTDELAMLRLRLCRITEIGIDKGNFEAAKATAMVVKAIGDTIEKIYKIQNATLGTETIPVIVTQIVNVLNENLTVCPHCGEGLKDISKVVFERLKEVKPTEIPRSNGSSNGNGKIKNRLLQNFGN